eukprot:SAG31_NODE_156_length_22055_cov_105.227728_7_plen_58_part_00
MCTIYTPECKRVCLWKSNCHVASGIQILRLLEHGDNGLNLQLTGTTSALKWCVYAGI